MISLSPKERHIFEVIYLLVMEGKRNPQRGSILCPETLLNLLISSSSFFMDSCGLLLQNFVKIFFLSKFHCC